jgi:DNA-binding MarR family transcriptional regulator/predicted RNA-binding Zn-ribbon protein involved in translation (DUF1610 family)
VVKAQGRAGAERPLRLTVKEKILLQLGESYCERDLGEYPIELTQKGLSEHLAVRRSHIAMSLKGLVEDELVDVRRERVEGEPRRQNIYMLTGNGYSRARELRERACSVEVEFETVEGTRRVKVRDLLESSRLKLIMVVNQAERGGPVREEIDIVTKREKKMVSVFCPTCKRSIEVENVFGDEIVGFDCPGCGRPYRILPAERVVSTVTPRPAVSVPALLVVLFVVFLGVFFLYMIDPVPALVLFGIAGASLVLLYLRRALAGILTREARISAAVIAVTFFSVSGFAVLWSIAIARLSIVEKLEVLLPVVSALVMGYYGVAKTASGLKGEFLVVAGLFMLLMAVSRPFANSIPGLDEDSMPFLGGIGVALLVLSTLHVSGRESRLTAVLFSTGLFVLVIVAETMLSMGGTVLGASVVLGFVLMGVVMVSMPVAQRRVSVSLSESFVASLPLSVGAGVIAFGVFVIAGGALVQGLLEIGLMLPFAYYGAVRVFDRAWMYKVPFVAFVVGLEALVIVHSLAT